jgi:hypothetical protein
MEGYPQATGCVNNDASDPSHNYHFNHNPFIFFADIQNSPARCSHIVNANSTPVSQTGCASAPLPNDDLLINDLNHPSTAANYSFLVPNTVDDAHDCDDVSASNAWLGEMIPQILGSSLFTTKRAALFITFDEPRCTNGTCPDPTVPPFFPQLYSVWGSSPAHHTTKVGFKSSTPMTLYNPLRTIEDNWNLNPLTSNDQGAQNMQNFFLP